MVPEDNSENALQAITEDAGAVFNEGAVFRVTELKPGFATPMLRLLLKSIICISPFVNVHDAISV
jgi:hypothetical protein